MEPEQSAPAPSAPFAPHEAHHGHASAAAELAETDMGDDLVVLERLEADLAEIDNELRALDSAQLR